MRQNERENDFENDFENEREIELEREREREREIELEREREIELEIERGSKLEREREIELEREREIERESKRGSKRESKQRYNKGGFHCCPYGSLVLVPTFWIAAATMCTFYAAFECTFFQVSGLFKHEVTVTYGLWSVEDYENAKVGNQEVYVGDYHIGTANSCSTWSRHVELTTEDIDGALQFGRVSILLACILGSVSLIWIVLAWWIAYSTCTVYLFVALKILAAVFTAFSFWALKSSYCVGRDCSLDFAGYIGIVAAVFWLLSACCSALLLRTDRRDKKKDKPERKKRGWRRRKNKRQDDVPAQDPEVLDDDEADLADESVPLSGDRRRDGNGNDDDNPSDNQDYDDEENRPPESGDGNRNMRTDSYEDGQHYDDRYNDGNDYNDNNNFVIGDEDEANQYDNGYEGGRADEPYGDVRHSENLHGRERQHPEPGRYGDEQQYPEGYNEYGQEHQPPESGAYNEHNQEYDEYNQQHHFDSETGSPGEYNEYNQEKHFDPRTDDHVPDRYKNDEDEVTAQRSGEFA